MNTGARPNEANACEILQESVMEIKLNRDSLFGWYQGAGISLCTDQLRREVHLPADEQKIYAVFSEKKTTDSFRINVPTNTILGKVSAINGLRKGIGLLISTRLVLAKAYKKGFRYVRIEY